MYRKEYWTVYLGPKQYTELAQDANISFYYVLFTSFFLFTLIINFYMITWVWARNLITFKEIFTLSSGWNQKPILFSNIISNNQWLQYDWGKVCHTQRSPPCFSVPQLELIDLHYSACATFRGQGEWAHHEAMLPLHMILLAAS